MISEDFNSEYDFIELKSYLCVRYPKQCIEIWQRWVTYSRLIPMTRSMRTKNGCDNTGVYRWSRKSAPTRRSGRSGNNSWQASAEATKLVVAKFSNAVRDLRGLAALVELCRIKVVRLVSIHDKIDTLGELFPDTTAAQVLEMVRGPARRGSRVTQVVQPYHATATEHQAAGNEEGYVAGGARKDHRGYVQQRLSH